MGFFYSYPAIFSLLIFICTILNFIMPSFFVDPDITNAKTLDKDFYLLPSYFESAKKKIFSSSWQFIGDSSIVKEQGSCHPFTLLENYLNEPLLMVRDKD